MGILDTIGVGDSVGGFDPSGLLTGVTWFVIIFVFAILAGAATWYIIYRRKFNKKIIIFRKVNGRFEPGGKDIAMEMKLGQGGDTLFYLSKHKKYLPTPELQVGRNTYWFMVREDGEWINVDIEDIDEQMRKVKAHFLDKEMRYARVALQRNLQDRYDKPSFWSKYGGLIAYVGLIMITGIMSYLLFDKYIELAGTVNGAVEAAATVLDATRDILVALDNVKG